MSESSGLSVKPGALVLLVLACASLLGTFVGLPIMLIFLAASALCGAIFLLWASLQTAGDLEAMDFEEALSFSAPGTEEEQKLAVLRALKDLEYERSLGKITREDYEAARDEYRARAKRLIAAHDASLKEHVEAAQRRVDRYLAEEPSKKSAQPQGPAHPKEVEA